MGAIDGDLRIRHSRRGWAVVCLACILSQFAISLANTGEAAPQSTPASENVDTTTYTYDAGPPYSRDSRKNSEHGARIDVRPEHYTGGEISLMRQGDYQNSTSDNDKGSNKFVNELSSGLEKATGDGVLGYEQRDIEGIIRSEDEEEEEEKIGSVMYNAAEEDSMAEIRGLIEAQAEEERRLAEEAAFDEARAHAAEREAVRQEAEEKVRTRRQARDNNLFEASTEQQWAEPMARSRSVSSAADPGIDGGSGHRDGVSALAGRTSQRPRGHLLGLGQGTSNRGTTSRFSSFHAQRGRVPPTSDEAQAEMMSAAFGSVRGKASFEEMNSQHQGGTVDRTGEENGTARAHLAAKLVLETDALLYGGHGGPVGAALLEVEGGDEDWENGEGAGSAGMKNVLAKDRTSKEIQRILQEGEKEEPNWYVVLGISRRAQAQAVKDSFRRLVLLIHPDKTSHLGAQEAFHLVQEAYESLSSPIERLAYDQYLVKLRAKRWKQRLRPLVDKVDDFSDYYEPILERKGQIAAAAFLLWALVL